MLRLYQTDKLRRHNGGSSQPVEPAPHRTDIHSTHAVQDPPVQNDRSHPSGPAQASYPLQSGHAFQQGNTTRQREGALAYAEDGGHVRPHNSNDNLSTVPTALSPSSSTVYLPNGPTQQIPPVTYIDPPDVDKDE
jgi:hypothetical protein